MLVHCVAVLEVSLVKVMVPKVGDIAYLISQSRNISISKMVVSQGILRHTVPASWLLWFSYSVVLSRSGKQAADKQTGRFFQVLEVYRSYVYFGQAHTSTADRHPARQTKGKRPPQQKILKMFIITINSGSKFGILLHPFSFINRRCSRALENMIITPKPNQWED